MSNHYILGGKDGREVIPVSDVLEWARFFKSSTRHVAKTTIRQPNRLLWMLGLRPDYWISTVFLGLNHNWGDGPPLLFETMVFKRWPGWKSWAADLRWPRRRGEIFKTDERFIPPRKGWVLEFSWLGFYKLFAIQNPLNRLQRWWKKNYHTMLPLIPYDWHWSESSDQDMDRYSTWEQAERGHRAMVAKWTSLTRGEKEETNV